MLSKLLMASTALFSFIIFIELVRTSEAKSDSYDVNNIKHLNLRQETSNNADMELDTTSYPDSTYIVTYQFADTTCDNFVSTETISSKSYTSAYAYALKKCFQDKATTNDYIRYKISENVPGQSDGYYIQTYLNNPCTSVPPNSASGLVVINVCNVDGATSSYTTSSSAIPTFASAGTMFA